MTDPVWSLCSWPVVLEVHGQDYEIPALPAVDWLAVLMAEDVDLEKILSHLCPNGTGLLFDESVDPEELYAMLLEVVSLVCGRPWWIALRLITVVRQNWSVLGAEMIYRNIDPARLSVSAWLDVMLVITIRAMEPKDVAMFTAQLELPPPGEEPAEEELVMSADQFLSMQ